MREVVFGNYKLHKRLAMGGMAELFLASHKRNNNNQQLVLKRLLPHLQEEQEFITMFLDESVIGKRLDHPNLIKVIETDTFQGQPYQVLEHIDGWDLQQILNSVKDITWEQATAIIIQACDGLYSAHMATDAGGRSLNLIHRDISPHNIMCQIDGVVKVLDFGIAKTAITFARTAVGVVKGKLPYLSPEQLRLELLDARSDQFSLAVVLYELLMRQPLFSGRDDLQIMTKMAYYQGISIDDLSEEIPIKLREVLCKALCLDKSKRFASMKDFAQNLRLCLDKNNMEQFFVKQLLEHFHEKMVPQLPAIKTRAKKEGLSSLMRSWGVSVYLLAGVFGGYMVPAVSDPLPVHTELPENLEVPPSAIKLSGGAKRTISSTPKALHQKPKEVHEHLIVKQPTSLSSNPNPKNNRSSAVNKYGRDKKKKTRPVDESKHKDQVRSFGFLSLRMQDSWAEVFYHGKSLGITPLASIKIPSGKHKLQLVNTITKTEKIVVIEIKPNQHCKKRVTW